MATDKKRVQDEQQKPLDKTINLNDYAGEKEDAASATDQANRYKEDLSNTTGKEVQKQEASTNE